MRPHRIIISNQIQPSPPDYSQLPSPVPAGLKAGAETTRRLPASFKAMSAPKKEFWPMNCPCESGFGSAGSGMEDGMYVRSISLLMSSYMLYLQLRGGVDPGAVPLDVVVDEGWRVCVLGGGGGHHKIDSSESQVVHRPHYPFIIPPTLPTHPNPTTHRPRNSASAGRRARRPP